jgi:hypothetical protein
LVWIQLIEKCEHGSVGVKNLLSYVS